MEAHVRLRSISIAVAGLAVATGWLPACAARQPVEPTPVALAAASLPTLASTVTLGPTERAAPAATPTQFPSLPVDLPLGPLAYRVPLTIRHVTTDRVTLYLELSQPSPGKVWVQPEDRSEPALGLELSPNEGRWLTTIEGLAPGTTYHVAVALEPEGQPATQPQFRSTAWGPVSFRTASEGEPLRIGLISDASFGDPATFDLVRQMAGAQLDFVLHAGDVVDETESGQDAARSFADKFYAPFEPLLTRMPVYTVPGNHDYDADIRAGESPFYYLAFPPFPDDASPGQEAAGRNQFYAFGRDDLQFVMLDTQTLYGVPGREEQEAWLQERLSDPRFGATIIVMHVAPFSSSSVHPGDSLAPRQRWVPLFEAARVPLVLSGHFHGFERLISNGLTYLVAGGGSAILYDSLEPLPQSQAIHRRTHFVLLEVEDQSIHATAYALGGEVLDQATIPLPPKAE